ncbi:MULTISPECIES: FtsW/RodA/SpoVE family cell cycle protein [Limosilactobacillus]|uniref:FtsW/RodA/SpoVE family cell cycle protein n=1 Tax=Limosilactobacillus TaxID=2742598 RepID=UPI002246C72F|nr:FtsW/RodA/SpoVE family cell cycle protein [Limosilactobacillus pontis]MCX2185899.1 FtsW/RodA/SpoVE family cell cycle protein [Limosilactobacillus pontis]MCX2187640.1 FtsW/RodA/SpoVE family cell cycle protein [Limosilactobacillus pontis]
MKKIKLRPRHGLATIKQNFHFWDYYLMVPYLVLCLIGIVMVYSSSAAIQMQNGGTPQAYLVKQTIYVILGVLVLLFCANYPLEHYWHRRFLEYSTVGMGFLLAVVLLIGKAVNGAKGWLNLGPINIQPVEFCKLYFILYLADRMARARQQGKHFLLSKSSRGPLILAAGYLILILVQPDTGGFAINACIIAVMILACDIRWGKAITAVIGFPLLVYFGLQLAIINGWLHGGYRIQRFIAFMNPFGNASGSGSQLVNSYYAISNGGIFGVGLGNSVQKMGYLPEPNTDFIMAITSEELGLVGVTVILVLLLVLICRMIQLGVKSQSLYQSLICYGSATFFTIETFFNIGGVLGLLPITGVTFPFISYGGSSILVLSATVGIIMNISIRQNKAQLEIGEPFLPTD